MSFISDTTPFTVVTFLDRLTTKEREKLKVLKLLREDPFKRRARCDIKKLKGKIPLSFKSWKESVRIFC